MNGPDKQESVAWLGKATITVFALGGVGAFAESLGVSGEWLGLVIVLAFFGILVVFGVSDAVAVEKARRKEWQELGDA